MGDFFGLGAYAGSSSESDDEHGHGDATEQAPPQRPAAPAASGEDDDDDDSGSDDSVDSVTARALAAEARLKDYNDAAAARQRKAAAALEGVLPSVDDAFGEVEGPPAFLDPEATRPIAMATAHGVGGVGLPAAGTGGKAGAGGAGTQDFDVAKLAPLLKGQKREGQETGPAGAVIEGKAKRYKAEGDDGPGYSAAQIALMGGNTGAGPSGAAGGAGGVVGPTPPPGPGGKERVGSKPMGVNDFLSKGEGAALLPRNQQERKDKEKLKRQKGQSAIGSWKTEAEMVLRQQFDS